LLPLALTAVNRALAADSGNADTWLTQALLSRNIDPTDDAPVLRSLRHAIALDSSDAPAWHFLALALAETENLNDALLSWHRSVTLDPSYTQGLVFLGLGYYWRRQYDSASRWADSAVALNPNYLLGRNTVGYIAIERGASERGVAAFEAGRRLSDDVEAVNSLAGVALAQARAGRRHEARANLAEAESEARAYAPVASHTALFFAQAYAALGDVDHAVTWLSRYQPRFRSLLTLPAPLPPRGC
jgi:tetratricopeptide (TPR) repeat protein